MPSKAYFLRLERNDPTVDAARVNARDCFKFAKALKDNTHVSYLNVFFDSEDVNNVDRRYYNGFALQWKAFCQTASSMSSLKKVVIEFDDHSEEDYVLMGLFLQHTRQITELEMRSTAGRPFRSPFLSHLAKGIVDHCTLEKISLCELRLIPVESLELFMLSFSSIPNLRVLRLEASSAWYSDRGDGRKPRMVDSFYLKRLLSLPSVEELTLRHFRFDDEHSAAFREGLGSSLLQFGVILCDMTSECLVSLIHVLGSHPHLDYLELNRIQILNYLHGDDAMLLAPLSRSTSLKRLVISFDGFEEDEEWPRFDFLRDNTVLKCLQISGQKLKRTSFASVYQALCTNSSLETLSLGDCCRKDTDADALLEMIRDNVSLKNLVLSGHTFSGAVLVKLARALSENSSLELLDIAPCPANGRISHKDTAVILEAVLVHSQRLKTLYMGICSAQHKKEKLLLLMAENYGLERLYIMDENFEATAEECDLEEALQIIARLNECGRCYLIDDERGPECTAAGVELLSAVSNSLDCLFFHLRENPLLCDLQGTGVGTDTGTVQHHDPGDTNSCSAQASH